MDHGTQAVWASDARDALRRAGFRSGGSRSLVIDALASHSCCRSAQDVHDELRTSDRAIGMASVYRALEQLQGLGLLDRVEVGDGTARFEPRLAHDDHHHHLVCTTCGEVTPFADRRLEEAIHDLAERLDHQVVSHDILLRGTCSRCRQEKK